MERVGSWQLWAKSQGPVDGGVSKVGGLVDLEWSIPMFGDLKITRTSTEREKPSQIFAPVLVIISGNSLVFSRIMITSTGFYWCCTLGASAPVVVKKSVS